MSSLICKMLLLSGDERAHFANQILNFSDLPDRTSIVHPQLIVFRLLQM